MYVCNGDLLREKAFVVPLVAYRDRYFCEFCWWVTVKHSGMVFRLLFYYYLTTVFVRVCQEIKCVCVCVCVW